MKVATTAREITGQQTMQFFHKTCLGKMLQGKILDIVVVAIKCTCLFPVLSTNIYNEKVANKCMWYQTHSHAGCWIMNTGVLRTMLLGLYFEQVSTCLVYAFSSYKDQSILEVTKTCHSCLVKTLHCVLFSVTSLAATFIPWHASCNIIIVLTGLKNDLGDTQVVKMAW